MKKRGKIGIITIYDQSPNYGNRLQNYAVQTVISKMGYDTVTYSFAKVTFGLKEKIKYIIHCITRFKFSKDVLFWKNMPIKIKKFEKFNRKYIHTKRIRNLADIPVVDYYVVGSDQVWNPTWYDDSVLKKEIYLLTFAEREKRVCFSPSFGNDSLPEQWERWFVEKLKDFPQISVRETAGAKIIKDLIGVDATVLIDPTMMLEKENWRQLSQKPSRIDCSKPYILTYFLGGRSQRVNNHLQQYAADLGANIYNLQDIENAALYIMDPCNFVYLIEHATLILTDSFHACVFSFFFEKPFLVYNREGTEVNMMARIDTFLNTFGLERKYVDSGLPNELLECDYDYGYDVLEDERNKVMDFLESSMGIV